MPPLTQTRLISRGKSIAVEVVEQAHLVDKPQHLYPLRSLTLVSISADVLASNWSGIAYSEAVPILPISEAQLLRRAVATQHLTRIKSGHF